LTGRSLADVAYKALTLGKLKVNIDGHLVTTVILSAATARRKVVYSKTWTSPGRHAVKLVWAGSSGHTRIDLDAFVVLG
jgi:hypothetical protein